MLDMAIAIPAVSHVGRYPLLNSQVCTLRYTAERIPETDEPSIAWSTLHGTTQRGRTTVPQIAIEPAVPHLKRSGPCDPSPANMLHLNPTFT